MDEKSKTEDSANDIAQNTEGSNKVIIETSQGLSELENLIVAPVLNAHRIAKVMDLLTEDGGKITDQETDGVTKEAEVFLKPNIEETSETTHLEDTSVHAEEINEITNPAIVTSKSEGVVGPHIIGINKIIDFEESSDQFIEQIDEAVYQSENSNISLNAICDSCSEGDSEEIYFEAMGASSTKRNAEKTDLEATTSVLTKDGDEIINHETDSIGISEGSETFPKLNVEETTAKMDLEVEPLPAEDVIEVAEQVANFINETDESEDMLAMPNDNAKIDFKLMRTK